MNRPLLLSATALVLVIAVGACGENDGDAAEEILPPIRTTTTTITTSTTISTDRIFYTVKRGEFLSLIAEAFDVPVQEIVELNGLTDANDIQAGQTIEIPTGVVLVSDLPSTTTPTATT
ncbi:MAG TPA: LysM domain-containing protein [Ilumatobacteraceae bacterium]|nr:LysM domain-containing protein [Ilumatobacteraceae bacterium]